MHTKSHMEKLIGRAVLQSLGGKQTGGAGSTGTNDDQLIAALLQLLTSSTQSTQPGGPLRASQQPNTPY